MRNVEKCDALKFGLQTAGDLFGMVKCGVEAEKAGFDMVWVGNHLTFWFTDVQYPETFVTLACIAMQTSRIRLGPGVVDIYLRHPAVIAQTIATLDVLSKGRVNLGIGAGEEMNLAPFGLRFDRPIARLREGVKVIKRLWEATPSSPADFTGQYYNLGNAFIQVRQLQKPHPPIYISATGRLALRLVGELADGWYAHLHSPETFKESVQEIDAQALKVGRDPKDIEKLAFVFASVAKDYDAALQSIRTPASMVLVLAKERLKALGYELQTPEWLTMEHVVINENNLKILRNAAKQVPVEAIQTTMAFGTPDDCISKFEAFQKAGATGIIIYNASPNKEESFDIFKAKIIPYFKEAS
jgi:alkanesulfonate monooxygenase SsuD/methylene tetrahydromethanopterin reductase-like flavin-dependent oxidoreductase (luciferase family)